MGRWVGCREKVFGSLPSNMESLLFNSLCVGIGSRRRRGQQVKTSHNIVKRIQNDVYDFFHKVRTVPNRLPRHSVVRTDSLETKETLPEELARGYNVRVRITQYYDPLVFFSVTTTERCRILSPDKNSSRKQFADRFYKAKSHQPITL